MIIEIIKVQRVIVPRRCERLIGFYSKTGKLGFEVESFVDTSNKLLQGDMSTATREIAMVCMSVDPSTWTTT